MFRKIFNIRIVLTLLVSANIVAMLSYAEAQSGCSLKDRNLLSSYFEALMEAVQADDISQYFQLLAELEKKLSPSCHAAIVQSQQQKPECSVEETNLISSSFEDILQALMNGDVPRYAGLLEDLENELSESCRAALVQLQQGQLSRQTPRFPTRPNPPPAVLDHGNGTFSVPGVGACSSTECIPFN